MVTHMGLMIRFLARCLAVRGIHKLGYILLGNMAVHKFFASSGWVSCSTIVFKKTFCGEMYVWWSFSLLCHRLSKVTTFSKPCRSTFHIKSSI
jgi:hypothetical protein